MNDNCFDKVPKGNVVYAINIDDVKKIYRKQIKTFVQLARDKFYTLSVYFLNKCKENAIIF